MSSSQHKHNMESVLTTVAESIGSTLGTIACRASGIPEAISHSKPVRTAEREGKNFVRRSHAVARRMKNAASKKVKTKKGESAKRVVRPSSAKRKIARRAGRKK
jgi:hypothetical protein